ncbi:MAG: glycosyltransferase [Spirirestis rafaelensis WJT71-NPBG6]|jgi:cellulose synthase (UDP-forming)|nr:glycosyltransferase [Spirirestis rafaelensis WJT71-NPBG6]
MGRQQKSFPKVTTQKIISPWVWKLFVCSFLVFIATVFFHSWSSTGPTLFLINEVNPSIIRNLPNFLQLPGDDYFIFLPVIGVGFFCILLRFIPSTNLTRLFVNSVLAVLAVRYLIWRTIATLNLSHWASTTFSIFLYVNEVICFISFFLYIFQSIWSSDRQRSAQANIYSQDVLSGRYLPSVDVFVPTYNEPEYIVRRTVIGCQAMEYPNKTIYILDDTRRPFIKALAEELRCEYITRPDNTHAKAGNLNNALRYTQGELITIMDADFVPFQNFLTRTVGFFKSQKISLVQTQQNFYNPDYHARNLGLDHFLPNDLEHFYGHLQSNRDVVNSVVCCGTSYVVRRKHLEAVGGYYTRCCVEDFQTSVLMLTNNFRLVYLNEMLSMGESTRTYADFIDQRLRWLQGNMQIYYCGDEVPMWSKLNWLQKTYAFSQLLSCLNPVMRFILLISPLLSAYLGVSPYLGSLPEVIFYFAPFMLLQIVSFGWVLNYRLSLFWYEVYETRFCFPALQRIWLVLRSPFGKASKVTRKGVKAESKNYNLPHNLPLLVLITLTVVIICVYLVGYFQGRWLTLPMGAGVMFFWLIYNGVLMSLAVLSAIDQPVRRVCDRFPLRTTCKLTTKHFTYWGHTHDISDSGAQINLTTQDIPTKDESVIIEFVEHGFLLEAEIVRSHYQGNYSSIAVKFTNVTVEQSRHLVTLLYTKMNWWKHSKKSGGLDSLFAMLSVFLKLRPALTKYD